MTPGPDPYETLGVSPRASDDELRAAYRRLVQLHHPDHNAGSAASARRFEEVQEAYAEIRKRRPTAAHTGGATSTRAGATRAGASRAGASRAGASRAGASRATRAGANTPPPPGTPADPATDARLAALEREIREARLARERARQSARATAAEGVRRPSPEELGYVTTDDSFGKILADAASQASARLAGVREPVTKRVADLLDELASKLSGGTPPPSGE